MTICTYGPYSAQDNCNCKDCIRRREMNALVDAKIGKRTNNMKRGKLIGIVGYAGSGKTTVTAETIKGNFIRADFTRAIKHRNFSRPIVNMLAAMGIPADMLNDKSRWNEPLDMLCGHSIRYAATTLGTEWGRDYIGQDVWTRIALAETHDLRDKGYHVIIDNVRFPSEMEAMRHEGATFIAMYRADNVVDTSHESEKHIDILRMKCDRVFDNNVTFNEAVEKMRKIIVDVIAE